VNAQSAVTPLQAKSVDIGAEGLGDAQAVQSEQARQGVIPSRSETGGNQEGTQLVAVQAHGVGLVVQAGPADVHSRGVLDEPFLLGVAVEAHDGGQAPPDRGPCTAKFFELSGEQLDLGSVQVKEADAAPPAPCEELAQVEGVGLAGPARVAGQEAGEGHDFGARLPRVVDDDRCGFSHGWLLLSEELGSSRAVRAQLG